MTMGSGVSCSNLMHVEDDPNPADSVAPHHSSVFPSFCLGLYLSAAMVL